jgi:hypothetical protein
MKFPKFTEKEYRIPPSSLSFYILHFASHISPTHTLSPYRGIGGPVVETEEYPSAEASARAARVKFKRAAQ